MSKIQEAIDKAKGRHQPAGGSAHFKDGPGLVQTAKASMHIGANEAWQAREADLVESDLQERRVIASLEHDDRVMPYRQLRTQVLKLMRDNEWKSLAITSAHEYAGKTLTATNLAISISRDVNHDVVLVDLDLRKPSVHENFSMEVDLGIADYLSGEAGLPEVLVSPGFKRLYVLPGKPIDTFASEMLASPAMRRLMAELRGDTSTDRVMIFDLPPLLRNDDALIVTPLADATLLIVEDGVTTEAQLEKCLRMLKDVNLIGTVLNKARF